MLPVYKTSIPARSGYGWLLRFLTRLKRVSRSIPWNLRDQVSWCRRLVSSWPGRLRHLLRSTAGHQPYGSLHQHRGADEVTFYKLQGIYNTEGFIHITAEGQIVNNLMLNDAFFVNQEETAQSDTVIRQQDIIAAGNVTVQIRNQWEVQSAQATFGFWGIDPRQVSVMAVYRDTQDLDITFFEFFDFVIKGKDFRD